MMRTVIGMDTTSFENDELMPYCDWMREADAEAVYYLGAVLDYHF